MDISFTKLSPNGQVVIPSEIRKKAGFKPATKFIVYNEGRNILLKEITPETLQKDMQLLETIQSSEKQIAKGNVTRATTDMDAEDIDELLMN